MAVVSFLLIMPASVISDRLGRKWTIVPSCIAIAAACVLMAASGELTGRGSIPLDGRVDFIGFSILGFTVLTCLVVKSAAMVGAVTADRVKGHRAIIIQVTERFSMIFILGDLRMVRRCRMVK